MIGSGCARQTSGSGRQVWIRYGLRQFGKGSPYKNPQDPLMPPADLPIMPILDVDPGDPDLQQDLSDIIVPDNLPNHQSM